MRGGRSNRRFIDLIDSLVEQDMSAHHPPCHLETATTGQRLTWNRWMAKSRVSKILKEKLN
jgi:hypothetical protein